MDLETALYIRNYLNCFFTDDDENVLNKYHDFLSWKSVSKNQNEETKIYLQTKYYLTEKDILFFTDFDFNHFLICVCQRIEVEYKYDADFKLNHCPVCNTIAKTPTTKRCRNNHSW